MNNKPRVVNIVAMADLHAFSPDTVDCQGADMILFAGDICPDGVYDEHGVRKWGKSSSKLEWLEKEFFPWCEGFYGEIVLTPGNRDKFVLEKPIEKIQWPSNVTCLIDEMKVVNGIKIYGTPWAQTKNHLLKEGLEGDGVFEFSPEGLKQKFAAIPQGLDILLCHSTPSKTDSEIDLGVEKLDNGVRKSARLGSDVLADAIWRTKPRVVVCGHIHAVSHRIAHIGPNDESKVVNASMVKCDDRRATGGHLPPMRMTAVFYENMPRPVFYIENRSVSFDRYYTQTGNPCDPTSGNPFEKDTYAAGFWELEAWLLNPETVNLDEVERAGRERLGEDSCPESIRDAECPENVRILMAAMEAKGRELEKSNPKVYDFSNLPWERFFDELPDVKPVFRYYHGEEECPYADRSDEMYWTSERTIAHWDNFSRSFYAFLASRRDWCRESGAPLVEQVVGSLAWDITAKFFPCADDVLGMAYFTGPKPKSRRVHITAKFKTPKEVNE